MNVARSVNIGEVARAAGVGTGTVSRVLNGSASVSATTRARVLAVITALGYRPSHLAASLSRGSPRTIAIVVPYLTRPSVVVRLAGAMTVFDAEGYDTVVFNVETVEQRDRHLESLTARHRADGVLIVSAPVPRTQLAALGGAGIPLVMIDSEAPGVNRIVADDAAGGRIATSLLLDLGHRRIGFIGDVGHEGVGNRSARNRLAGYRSALDGAGVDYDRSLVRNGPHGAHSAELLAEGLLRRPSPPSAVFAASDTQAIGVLGAADRLGVAVPDELSVVGYDDIDAAALLGLTTVRQPLERSGTLGADRLCALVRGEVVRPVRQRLPLEVVTRASTARPHARPHARRAGAVLATRTSSQERRARGGRAAIAGTVPALARSGGDSHLAPT